MSTVVTGSHSTSVLLVALVVLGTGFVLWRVGRRRGIGGRTAVVVVLGLGAAGVAMIGVRTAVAAPCPSPTTTVAAATTTSTPSTIASTTSSTTTTIPAATTTSTTAATTTTTAAATTTTTIAATTTTAAAATTTTTEPTTTTTIPPVADLTPSITGPTAAVPGVRGAYTLTISNVGTGSTSGLMSFTLGFDLDTGSGTVSAEPLASTDWTFVGSAGGNLNYVSNVGFTLAPGGASTTTFGVTWSTTLPPSGSFTITATLPAGIGGETNGANNTASTTVDVVPPPP